MEQDKWKRVQVLTVHVNLGQGFLYRSHGARSQGERCTLARRSICGKTLVSTAVWRSLFALHVRVLAATTAHLRRTSQGCQAHGSDEPQDRLRESELVVRVVLLLVDSS